MVTATAAEKKADEKARYNAFLSVCPSQRLLAQVSGKWVTLVLSALGSGPECDGDPRPMRYSELGRVLAGVSPKMLSQTLRSLERGWVDCPDRDCDGPGHGDVRAHRARPLAAHDGSAAEGLVRGAP
jgi:hypothetical protein